MSSNGSVDNVYCLISGQEIRAPLQTAFHTVSATTKADGVDASVDRNTGEVGEDTGSEVQETDAPREVVPEVGFYWSATVLFVVRQKRTSSTTLARR